MDDYSKPIPRDNSKIKLAIVDDHRIFGEGLKRLLEHKAGFNDFLLYTNATDALRTIPREKPDLSLIDINLPDMDGVELTRKILKQEPALKVVILTVDDSKKTVLPAISSGAYGYLLKSASLNNIISSIFTVLEGDLVIGAEVAPLVFGELRDLVKSIDKPPSPLLERLGKREHEVLQKVAEGKGNHAIADELFISEKTVKNYVSHLMEKLEVPDRMQLIVFAIKEGLQNQGEEE